MTIKDKLNNFILKKQMQVQEAKNTSIQKQDDKQRKKINKLKGTKPSWKKDILMGLATHDNPIGVMKKSIEWRKYERENR